MMKPPVDPTADGSTWRVTAPTALESGSDPKRMIDLDPGTLIQVERSTWGYDYRTTGQAMTVHLRVLEGRAVGKSLVIRAIEGLDPIPPPGLEMAEAAS